MSAFLPNNRLSTNFAYHKVEAVGAFGVPALTRDHSLGMPSVASSVASTTARETHRNIDRAEPCFITKRPSYTLERAHWVNAVRKDAERKLQVELSLQKLGIVRKGFNLNDTTNLVPLDRMLHVSLDKLGFFAVTCSVETLTHIIEKVREENAEWLRRDREGIHYARAFYLNYPPFSDAQYEMVLLHPEHFLPNGTDLTFYSVSGGQRSSKPYVVGHDRTLREAPGTPGCPRLPAFSFDAVRSEHPLDPFLVILNAEINFRRYRRMNLLPLSPDVEKLIDMTIELVDLIYWLPDPVRTEYRELAAQSAVPIQDDSGAVPDVEMGRLGRSMYEEENNDHILRRSRTGGGAMRDPGDDATLEERRAYRQYLISGRDNDLDSDDEELLNELGLGPGSLETQAVPEPVDPAQVSKMVRDWQHAIEVQ